MFHAIREMFHHQMYGAACPPHTLPITIYLTRLLTPTGVGGLYIKKLKQSDVSRQARARRETSICESAMVPRRVI